MEKCDRYFFLTEPEKIEKLYPEMQLKIRGHKKYITHIYGYISRINDYVDNRIRVLKFDIQNLTEDKKMLKAPGGITPYYLKLMKLFSSNNNMIHSYLTQLTNIKNSGFELLTDVSDKISLKKDVEYLISESNVLHNVNLKVYHRFLNTSDPGIPMTSMTTHFENLFNNMNDTLENIQKIKSELLSMLTGGAKRTKNKSKSKSKRRSK